MSGGPVAAMALAAAALAAAPGAAAEPPPPCQRALADVGGRAAVLAAITQYRTTYVLAFVDRPALAGGLSSPALRDLEVGVHVGAAEALAREVGLTRLRRYALAGDEAGVPTADLLAGRIGAALLWAPLAGLALVEGDPDYRVSLVTASGPREAPSAGSAPGGEAAACAEAIQGLLAAYGVVPAEATVRAAIEPLLGRRPPPTGREEEEKEGGGLFARHCAQCHGREAVADPAALAPVHLMPSVRRFTYPGFLYIVLNGRPQRGHPGFRGKLRETQIERIYQYLRARSRGARPASGRMVP